MKIKSLDEIRAREEAFIFAMMKKRRCGMVAPEIKNEGGKSDG